MSYQAILDRLFRMSASLEIRLNLETPNLLAEHLDFPERAYPTIHVAGTNGKGSTVTKIAKALELSGLKVGLYTSPHIASYRERITINGKEITEKEIVKTMEGLFQFVDDNKIPATFFELTTLLAFDHFRAQKIDVAVIETGLGGRLDATNIVQPVLTVITSISRDHADILGQSLEEIGGEKAGILKEGVPLVLGPRALLSSILQKAEAKKCPVIRVPKTMGFYDEENCAIARTALEYLTAYFPLTPHAIEEGLCARPPCRFEKRGEVIFDVAHNPDGFSRLIEALQTFHPKREIYALVGMCKDKEYARCLSMLSAYAKKIFLVRASSARAAEPEEMGKALSSQGFDAFVCGKEISSTVVQAAEEAKKHGALLVICGSFYIMRDALLTASQPS